jgi:ABC-type transport system involved in multi-copper enzyme maturation permease subunit
MTAIHRTPRPDSTAPFVRPIWLSGFRGLLRKELTEWRRAPRTLVVLLVTALVMALLAMNSWLQAQLIATEGMVGMEGMPAPVLDPLLNLLAAASAQIFVIASIFAVMGVLVAERESGTLAWTASKPVSRGAIWLAKFISSTGVLWLVAGLIPLATSAGLVIALYGVPPVGPIVIVAAGIGMAIALYIAVSLAASTVVTSQAAVAGIALLVTFLPQFIGAALPIADYLPTSILEWSLAAAAGQPAGIATVMTWAFSVVGLVAFSVSRMELMEL